MLSERHLRRLAERRKPGTTFDVNSVRPFKPIIRSTLAQEISDTQPSESSQSSPTHSVHEKSVIDQQRASYIAEESWLPRLRQTRTGGSFLSEHSIAPFTPHPVSRSSRESSPARSNGKATMEDDQPQKLPRKRPFEEDEVSLSNARRRSGSVISYGSDVNPIQSPRLSRIGTPKSDILRLRSPSIARSIEGLRSPRRAASLPITIASRSPPPTSRSEGARSPHGSPIATRPENVESYHTSPSIIRSEGARSPYKPPSVTRPASAISHRSPSIARSEDIKSRHESPSVARSEGTGSPHKSPSVTRPASATSHRSPSEGIRSRHESPSVTKPGDIELFHRSPSAPISEGARSRHESPSVVKPGDIESPHKSPSAIMLESTELPQKSPSTAIREDVEAPPEPPSVTRLEGAGSPHKPPSITRSASVASHRSPIASPAVNKDLDKTHSRSPSQSSSKSVYGSPSINQRPPVEKADSHEKEATVENRQEPEQMQVDETFFFDDDGDYGGGGDVDMQDVEEEIPLEQTTEFLEHVEDIKKRTQRSQVPINRRVKLSILHVQGLKSVAQEILEPLREDVMDPFSRSLIADFYNTFKDELAKHQKQYSKYEHVAIPHSRAKSIYNALEKRMIELQKKERVLQTEIETIQEQLERTKDNTNKIIEYYDLFNQIRQLSKQ